MSSSPEDSRTWSGLCSHGGLRKPKEGQDHISWGGALLSCVWQA